MWLPHAAVGEKLATIGGLFALLRPHWEAPVLPHKLVEPMSSPKFGEAFGHVVLKRRESAVACGREPEAILCERGVPDGQLSGRRDSGV